ncbi:TonB-dependent receptor family protein [Massilia cavernae]|uniref:TonB-dependent receptor n=1 Tax=Massilia cavernae TaxID=2320864 RepID=A0A418XRK9_9BURK|nr:TonB-dependent receptor [Massilia cavernae]RJG15106.1 TonB-dependent receptor [Massilia cavernae]
MNVSAVPAKPLALALALSVCFAAPAVAQQSMPTVYVTGARFASDPALAPIGATVIDAGQIRRAGVTDVNQAIRKIGGVYGRQSLDGSPDFMLDLRGFGSNSSQNMVVVLDGVRLSENELSGPILSTIPIETVERIEIIRGGASVLYGDGATGGVIQIVTKRAEKDGSRGMASFDAGQFGLRELRASAAHSFGAFALDASVSDLKTDNYRDHNAFDNRSFSGGLAWSHANGRVSLRLDSARQESEFPGSLTQQQFDANPRRASTPLDFGSLDSDRVTALVEHRIGNVDLAAELSHREKTAAATYYFTFGGSTSASALSYDSRQTQFSPRLRHRTQLDGMLNELVAGVDLIRWSRDTTSSFSAAEATQDSKALYLRDELRWSAAHNGRLSAGVRRESFDKETVDPLAFPPMNEAIKQSQTAWEVQGSMDVAPLLNVHAKAGRSYRAPNSDENAFRSTTGPLRIQTSRDLEVGAAYGTEQAKAGVRVFRHAIDGEIFYDPTLNFGFGANTNLDPTRRQGVEVDAQARVAADWRVNASYQHVQAEFTEGPNAGREMVLVPKNVLSARLSWVPAGGHSADVGVQWVDSQRFGNDFSNSCGSRIPSYTTIDARYARRVGPWEFAVSGLNLADKDYYSNAFLCRAGIYPGDGRQLRASVRYDF